MDVVSVLPAYLEVFLGQADVEGGLPLEDQIPRDRFDFTLESLKALDDYLIHLHEICDVLPEQQVINLATGAGAYIGEVIRRNCKLRTFTWRNHAEFLADNPNLSNLLPFGPGTAALLTGSTGGMTLPINKVIRFIFEGPENSVHYYAAGEISQR